MDFTGQQDDALKSINVWYKQLRNNFNKANQVFRLFGYAGTGKTTLAKHIAEHVTGDVVFGAFTGKAAQVLKEKGCPKAQTIHSMIYQPKPVPKEVIEKLKENLKIETDKVKINDLKSKIKNLNGPKFQLNIASDLCIADLIILDECSMINQQIAEDLMYFDKPILVLGDPGQLPPVKGGGYFTDQEPDILLTEIHRQAKDSPIIHMATMVRQGKQLPFADFGGMCRKREKRLFWDSDDVKADQILCGKNATRRNINSAMRSLLGKVSSKDPLSCYPKKAEKLICLRNNHEFGLLNGLMGNTLEDSVYDEGELSIKIKLDFGGDLALPILKEHFLEYETPGLVEHMPYWERREVEEFDYAYAITVHKSQGSQWKNVCFYDDGMSHQRNKLLYTAITRASERVVIYA